MDSSLGHWMIITLTPRWMGGRVAFLSSVNGKLLRGFKQGNSTIQFPLKRKRKKGREKKEKERREKERKRKEERKKKLSGKGRGFLSAVSASMVIIMGIGLCCSKHSVLSSFILKANFFFRLSHLY